MKPFILHFIFYALVFFIIISVCGCTNSNISEEVDIKVELITTTIDDIYKIYPNTHLMIDDPQLYRTRSITEDGEEIICESRFFNGNFHVTSIESSVIASNSTASDESLLSIADIEIGHTTAVQLTSMHVYNTEYKFNKTHLYIYENGIRYCVTLVERQGVEIVDSVRVIDNAAYLESVSCENHSEISIHDFAFVKPAVTTFEEITSQYSAFYTDNHAGYTRIIYTLNDNSHLFIGFDAVNGKMCVAHLYWIINLDEKANLPYATTEFHTPANNIQPYCDQIIIGTDTRSSVSLNYEERKTMETSTGPTSIVKDTSGHWLGLYYSGYGNDEVICIDWLDSKLPHRDLSIDYNPYGITLE